MSEKKTSTPKEIPLHEAVLKVMYEASKERPAELTISEVYASISDPAISEISVSDVLNWLVAQKQVERASGKYTLDRYSFLEQRAKGRAENGEKENPITEENPLHEVILSLMFESNAEEPAKLTLDDVFWKVSDPKIQKSLVGDALKWLLNQGRVEYLSGKYSLDRIEFQDQGTILEKESKVKKPAKKPAKPIKPTKPAKEAVEKKPKIVIPPAKVEPEPKTEVKPPKETPTQKKTPQEKKPVVKKEPKPKVPKPVEVIKQKKSAPQPVETVKEPENDIVVVDAEPVNSKWRMPLMIAAAICVVYTFYLLFALNNSTPAKSDTSSKQMQNELISTQNMLNELSEKESASANEIDILKEKIVSIQRINLETTKTKQPTTENEQFKSLLLRLIIANCLTLFIFLALVFSSGSTGFNKKV